MDGTNRFGYRFHHLARSHDAEMVINQMDLWQSGDLFCWMMPQAMKLELLRMRQSFGKNNP